MKVHFLLFMLFRAALLCAAFDSSEDDYFFELVIKLRDFQNFNPVLIDVNHDKRGIFESFMHRFIQDNIPLSIINVLTYLGHNR